MIYRTPIIFLLFITFVYRIALGHESPDHVIQSLNQRIADQGPTADMLLSRASEYRALGKLDNAANDLQHVIRLNYNHLGAHVELSRVLLKLNRYDKALATINQAIELATSDGIPPHLQAVRADIYYAASQFELSLEDYSQAIRGQPNKIDWYLSHARVLRILNRRADLVTALRSGYEITASGVLYAQWIEALLDTNNIDDAKIAINEIELRLKEMRLKSTWLIRRARAHILLDQAGLARLDLHEAIMEITTRLDTQHPDLTLRQDLVLAHRLLETVE